MGLKMVFCCLVISVIYLQAITPIALGQGGCGCDEPVPSEGGCSNNPSYHRCAVYGESCHTQSAIWCCSSADLCPPDSPEVPEVGGGYKASIIALITAMLILSIRWVRRKRLNLS